MSLPFHGFQTMTQVAGAVSLAANPNSMTGFTRLLQEADGWAHFRWQRMKFRAHHGSMTGDAAIGYVGGVQDTLPASKSLICELLPSVYYGSTYTVPSEWVNIPKADLSGPLPWYKTVPGAADATEEIPGYFVIAGVNTDVVILEVRGIIQFKTSVGPANTPLVLRLRAELQAERSKAVHDKARERVLAVLSPTVPGLAGKGGNSST